MIACRQRGGESAGRAAIRQCHRRPEVGAVDPELHRARRRAGARRHDTDRGSEIYRLAGARWIRGGRHRSRGVGPVHRLRQVRRSAGVEFCTPAVNHVDRMSSNSQDRIRVSRLAGIERHCRQRRGAIPESDSARWRAASR